MSSYEKHIAEQAAKAQSIRQSDFDSPQKMNEQIRQAEFAAQGLNNRQFQPYAGAIAPNSPTASTDNLHDMHNRLSSVIHRTNEIVENFTALLSAIDGKPPEAGEPQKNSLREGVGFVCVISEQIDFMASRLLILERLRGRLERVISG